jgi:hypothetical protein
MMSRLLSSLKSDDHFNNPASLVADAVAAGLKPFESGGVILWYTPAYHSSFGSTAFYAEVKVLPDHIFKHLVEERDFITEGPESVFYEVAEAAFNYFRNFRVEPEDHIILGED